MAKMAADQKVNPTIFFPVPNVGISYSLPRSSCSNFSFSISRAQDTKKINIEQVPRADFEYLAGSITYLLITVIVWYATRHVDSVT